MKNVLIACVLSLMVATGVYAEPVSLAPGAVWSELTPDVGNGSWDCATCGVGAVLNSIYGNGNVEYLNDGNGNTVPYTFVNGNGAFELIYKNTAYDMQNSLFWFEPGAFNFGSVLIASDPVGTASFTFPFPTNAAFLFLSPDGQWTSNVNGDQTLVARVVGDEHTFLFAWEDLSPFGPNDHDKNDFIVVGHTLGPVVDPHEGPTPTPEPTSMVLMGMGLIGLAKQMRKRREGN